MHLSPILALPLRSRSGCLDGIGLLVGRSNTLFCRLRQSGAIAGRHETLGKGGHAQTSDGLWARILYLVDDGGDHPVLGRWTVLDL